MVVRLPKTPLRTRSPETEEIAKGKRIAFLASRTNTMLSIPLLMSMVGAHHGFFL